MSNGRKSYHQRIMFDGYTIGDYSRERVTKHVTFYFNCRLNARGIFIFDAPKYVYLIIKSPNDEAIDVNTYTYMHYQISDFKPLVPNPARVFYFREREARAVKRRKLLKDRAARKLAREQARKDEFEHDTSNT